MTKARGMWVAVQVLAIVLLSAVAPLGALADPVGGSQWGTHRVDAYSSRSFNVECSGGEWTAVSVTGDGDTDLDLYVYDGRGVLIASDTDSSDRCSVLFYAIRGGTFRIVVRNYGDVYNEFRIGAY